MLPHWPHDLWCQSWVVGICLSHPNSVLAVTGSAVGIGNIWKFPYIVGVGGGGAFVLIYLGCVAFVAIPILITELWLGRKGGASPPVAMSNVAAGAGRSGHWSIVGYVGMIVGYLIATYYSVIAGWTLAYIFKAGNDFGGALPAEVGQQFDALLADPAALTMWHTAFMIIAIIIVGRGLRGGIEKAVKFLMPALFLLLVVMVAPKAVAPPHLTRSRRGSTRCRAWLSLFTILPV